MSFCTWPNRMKLDSFYHVWSNVQSWAVILGTYLVLMSTRPWVGQPLSVIPLPLSASPIFQFSAHVGIFVSVLGVTDEMFDVLIQIMFIRPGTAQYLVLMLLHISAMNHSHLQRATVLGGHMQRVMQLVSRKWWIVYMLYHSIIN